MSEVHDRLELNTARTVTPSPSANASRDASPHGPPRAATPHPPGHLPPPTPNRTSSERPRRPSIIPKISIPHPRLPASLIPGHHRAGGRGGGGHATTATTTTTAQQKKIKRRQTIWAFAILFMAASAVLLGFAIAMNLRTPVLRQYQLSSSGRGDHSSTTTTAISFRSENAVIDANGNVTTMNDAAGCNHNNADPVFWQAISMTLLRVLLITCLCIPVLQYGGSPSTSRGQAAPPAAPAIAVNDVPSSNNDDAQQPGGGQLPPSTAPTGGGSPLQQPLNLRIGSRLIFFGCILLALVGELVGLALFATICGNGGWLARLLLGWAGAMGAAGAAAQLAVGLERA